MKAEQLFEAIPGKIKTAVYLVYASVILRILRTSLTTVGRDKLNDPQLLTVIIMGSLLICLIGFKIGQGKNWARIGFLILAMWDLIAYPIFLSHFQATLIFNIVTIISLVIQLYTIFIIFGSESSQWFNKPINQTNFSCQLI